MRAHLPIVLTALVAGLSMASAAAASRDACSLLTSADAQAALGESVGAARAEDGPQGAADGSSCRYRSATGRAFSSKSVSLNVRYSDTDLTGSSIGIAENLKAAGFKNVHEVAGVGSAAIWGSNSILGRSQGELSVIQGKAVMLIVIVDGIPNELEALARAKAIATRAIGKL